MARQRPAAADRQGLRLGALVELLGTESLQTFGGSGFLQDYPIEQYIRDAKIDTLYEGTTAIQGQDFFFRKIVKDQGKALGHLAEEIQAFVEQRGRQRPAQGGARAAGHGARGRPGDRRRDDQRPDERRRLRRGRRPRNIYKVGLNTSRLLMALGDVVCAWLLLRRRRRSRSASCPASCPAKDKAFYEGKVAAAQFFAQTDPAAAVRASGPSPSTSTSR